MIFINLNSIYQMRKNLILLTAFIFFSILSSYSQSVLYMSDEVKNAYENKTRAFDGKPGENYFQNYTFYNITASVEPETGLLTGSEKVIYKNNSKDTLSEVVFNLYADIYKKGNIRDWSIGSADLHDGVQIKSLKINNKEIALASENVQIYNTAMTVYLEEKINPNSEMSFEIEWEFPIAKQVTIRQGTYHETSFFVAYWYPKIAVYDDIFGWNNNVYSGQTEFYHEYSDYKVSIHAPDEYFVLASGILKNEESVLEKNVLTKYIEAKQSDSIIRIVTEDERNNQNVSKGDDAIYWNFEAENIPDFAFAMSDTYLWDATSLNIGDKRVIVNAIYFPENESFNQVAEISKEVIKQLSTDVIGIDFPYPQMTAFMGHYGMEFPGMINDGDGDYAYTVFVTAHEITHSYFPFYVATNEVKYAWMDEGLVTFLPKLIENNMIEDNNSSQEMISTYNYYCGTSFDFPLMIPSDQLSGFAYRFHAYSKSATAFMVLKLTLGEELFDKCLKEFIYRWNGKHPTGYDFFFTFEDVSGEELDWFWKSWFFDFGYPDLSLKKISQISDSKTNIEIEKIGNYPVPIKLTIVFDDDSVEVVDIKTSVWKNNEIYHLEIENNKKIKNITLGDEIIPDKDNTNNFFEN